MNRQRVLSGFVGMLVALALLGVSRAEAQSADQFVGKWTITFAPPAGMPGGGGPGGGGFQMPPTVIEVSQSDGALAATMTGGGFGMGGGGQGGAQEPRPISDVKVVSGSLVLTYTMTMGPNGDAMPVTLKLTPDDDTTAAEQDMGNGRVRTGTAVKG